MKEGYAVSDSNVIKLAQPGAFTGSLTEILRSGARALLTQAVEAEVAEFLAKHTDLKTETGQQRVVRHGHLPEREIMTGIGRVAVRQPRVRDREATEGARIRYSPSILPRYARRSQSLEVLIPILYLKGISTGDFEEALAALVGKGAPGLSAETDRAYAGGGHSLDFINKAFECLDIIGWEYAADVLPSVVGQIAAARGAEERTAWRQPVDLIALCQRAGVELPHLFTASVQASDWSDHVALSNRLLGDDPTEIVDALAAAAREGASPADLGRSLAYAAALRVARFGTANEHSDWETAHHVFTYTNALHQALKRIGSARPEPAEAVRGLLHGAMALYLARYLNVPPASLPGESGDGLNDLPIVAEEIGAALLDTFDRQRQIDAAARLVARHLTLGHSPDALIATLAQALLREDAGFHAYQMLEAGVRQFHEWGNCDQGRHILIAVVRYLAAHFPTQRALLQTTDIASRLMRGGELHREAQAAE